MQTLFINNKPYTLESYKALNEITDDLAAQLYAKGVFEDYDRLQYDIDDMIWEIRHPVYDYAEQLSWMMDTNDDWDIDDDEVLHYVLNRVLTGTLEEFLGDLVKIESTCGDNEVWINF